MSNIQINTFPQSERGDHTSDIAHDHPATDTVHLGSDDDQKNGEVQQNEITIDTLLEAQDDKTTKADRAARAGIEQKHVIPTVGESPVTSKWEKYMFMIFRMSVGGTAISSYGASKNQAFLRGAFPSGKMPWGGQVVPINSFLLDLNGILFAAQLFFLLTIGPYADYGRWRPYLLIFFELSIYICCFALAGFNSFSDWRAVTTFWFLGNLSLNLANTFYYAGFLAVVENFPEIRQSELQVLEGSKTPEEHGQFDSLSRAKFYNYCIGVASTINLVLLGIATGIAAGIGVKTKIELLKGYQVLICIFAVLELACTSPYMYIFAKRNRPGQALPTGVPFYLAGVLQVKQAVRYAWDLKQFLLYLFAYFAVQEAYGTANSVTTILQNQVIDYNTIQLSGLTALDFFTGATGTLFINFVQQRWKFKSKSMLLYGGIMSIVPAIWGGIGAFTNVIGFHHVWEFWLNNVWNFQAAAWNSYYVTLLSEVVPQPKIYLFFSLLNCVGKTSGFIGPFISSAIVKQAGGNTNMAYWFLVGISALGICALWFVDVESAKIDVAQFLEREAEQLYSEEQRKEARDINPATL